MLPIIEHPVALLTFVSMCQFTLYQPQMRHLLQVMDALLVCPGKKTLSNLYRHLFQPADPKTAADFFRESPWQREEIGLSRKQTMFLQFLKMAQKLGLTALVIGVDDSLGKKHKATRHLEAVAYHHDHNDSTRKKPTYANGFVYVGVHIHFGPFGFTFDTRLYLRECTVRALNRQRSADQRLHYRSKYALAREMLLALAELLPKGYQVYVTFDSWYASERLIKLCRRHGWHVICALKRNRKVGKQRLDHHDLALKHRRYQQVTLTATDRTRPAPVYYVRTVDGALENISGVVRAIISRRHKGDQSPKFFMCTDLQLSAQEALRLYQRRWPVEVDNLYLKEGLGVGDFRLQSFEATDKWFAVALLSLNYLQYQQAQHYVQTREFCSLAECLRQHRLTHWQRLIRAIAHAAHRTDDVEAVIQQFMPTTDWAILAHAA